MSNLPNITVIVGINKHLSQVVPKAVSSNLVIWSSASLATVFLFNILRPRNKIIYEPKVKYHVGDKAPPPIDNGFFSWVSPLFKTTEDVLLDKVGLDAVTFLRFLRMMSWIFLLVSIITCGALIPINVTYNNKHVDPEARNTLSVLTIQDVQGTSLFFHVAASYLINVIVLVFVYLNWRKIITLRYSWFRSDEYNKSFYARTLMVLNVPKKIQSDEGLQSLFAGLQMPYPTTSVHIGHRVGQLPELIEYHNNTVRSFEQVLVRYLKGGKIGKKRPTITIGGSMGCGGEKKDAIDFYTRKLAKTEAAVQEWREKAESNKVENYGFASLAAVPYAHIVAQRLAGKHPKGTTITLAPNPKDIIWKNITMSDATRRSQKMMGWFWLVLVCFFNTIPLFRYQGAITHSRLDRAVVARYFAFLIISQLFIFSLLGVGFQLITQIVISVQNQQSVWEILKSTKELPQAIHATYISQSPYWLTFFPLRGFLAVFDLAQLLNVVWIWIKTRLFGRTPRDIREWTQPPEFEYSIYYSNLLFMGAVGLVYAPLAPLVALAAAVVFWISSFVYKYQIMFVFVSKVESGGRLWNPVINRLLTSLVLMQLLMTLTIGLAHGWRSFYWVSCLPPLLAVLVCKIWWSRTFRKQFTYYIPSDQEIAQATVYSGKADNKSNRLERRFGHPALHADLFTPMLHKKMMPLLSEVYHGRLASDQTKLDEYGGQKMQAQIAPGGVKIAAVDEHQLEYDPALYQRDRGELDWDTRSVSGTTVLGDGQSTLKHAKSGFYASSSGHNAPAGYDEYLQHGPQRAGTPSRLGVSSYEMSRLGGSEANLPLLASRSNASFNPPPQGNESSASLHERSPSGGPNAIYGSNAAYNNSQSGYFPSPTQEPGYHPQQRSGSSMGYHARANSAGFDQTVAAAIGYSPQQQEQGHPQSRSGSSMGYHSRANSAGFDQTVAAAGGYGPQQGQGYHPQSRSGSSMGYHSRANSAGFDQTVAHAAGYPQHQQQQQQYYPDRSQTPGGYPQRSGSGMGYYQQGPAGGQRTESPNRYYTPSPDGGNGGGNMAGRGAHRPNY
ncbi:DUF221-domain-containing protein [Serendipita vermifera]|nr:DUF221-domain-containing protein [Serendipita vermifera]